MSSATGGGGGDGEQRPHSRRDSASQVDEAALTEEDCVGHDDRGGDDTLTAAATHHPVVLVRLPLRRPRARPWTREEEARLTSVCQERWPRVDCEYVSACLAMFWGERWREWPIVCLHSIRWTGPVGYGALCSTDWNQQRLTP